MHFSFIVPLSSPLLYSHSSAPATCSYQTFSEVAERDGGKRGNTSQKAPEKLHMRTLENKVRVAARTRHEHEEAHNEAGRRR